jgi:Legume lectin domain/CHAP domain
MRSFLVAILSLVSFITVGLPATDAASGGHTAPQSSSMPARTITHSDLLSGRASHGASFTIDRVHVKLSSRLLPQSSFDVASPGAYMQTASASSANPLRSLTVATIPFGTSSDWDSHVVARWGAMRRLVRALQPRLAQSSKVALPGIRVDGRVVRGTGVTGRDPLDRGAAELRAVWIARIARRFWAVTLLATYTSRADLANTEAKLGGLALRLANPQAPTTIGRHPRTALARHADIAPGPSLPFPSWWNGDCDSGNNVQHNVIGSWGSLEACGYNDDQATAHGLEWECPELTSRYVYLLAGFWLGYDNNMASGMIQWAQENASSYPQMTVVYPGNGQLPQPGDVIGFGGYDPGHVAVVIGVDSNSYTTLNENWDNGAPGSAVQTWEITNGVPQFPGGYAQGWIHIAPSTPFSVSLSASSTTPNAGDTVDLTATANQDVSSSPYDVTIWNVDTGGQVADCQTGITCDGTVQSASAVTYSYQAEISAPDGSNVQAVSDPLPVTWSSRRTKHRLVVNGSAQLQAGRLLLTSSHKWQAGSAFDALGLDVTRPLHTQFELRFSGGTAPPADGMEFVLQSGSAGAHALGQYGEGKGYGGISPSVAVAFDTYQGPGEPEAGYVGFALNGGSAASTSQAFDLYGHGPVHVWVDYSSSSHFLTVLVSHNPHRSVSADSVSIGESVNLSSTLGRYAWVGFTGGTGYYDSTQVVHWWRLGTLTWQL